MKKLTSIFISFLFFVFFLGIDDVYADMQITRNVIPMKFGPQIEYGITSREDNPVTITGYQINRGNTLSDQQSVAKNFKFPPKTIKFGQTIPLFTVGPKENILEIEVFTDKGNYKFNF